MPRHAERRIVGLRFEPALLPPPHAESGCRARNGRLAGALRAVSERALRCAHIRAAQAPRVGRRGRAASDQAERARGAAVRRARQAPGLRRGRCDLRAQAPTPRRAAGRFAVAAQEVRGDLPLGGGGRGGQRRARGRRPAGRARGRGAADLDRRRLLSADLGRAYGSAHDRVDRKPRESRLPRVGPSGPGAPVGAPSLAQDAGHLLGVSRLARGQDRARRVERGHGSRLARGGSHRRHAAHRRCLDARQVRIQIAAVHGRLAPVRRLGRRRQPGGRDRRLQRLSRRCRRGLGAQPRDSSSSRRSCARAWVRTAASTWCTATR